MTSPLAPLLTPEGARLLAHWEEHPGRERLTTLELGERLRRNGLPHDLAAALLTQLDLRAHAARKFGPHAHRLLLTRDGLEQATRLVVASHHARRFRTAGAHRVADLGCGIGGDALALALAGISVIAHDLDEDAATCAAHNLAPFPGCEVRRADVTTLDVPALVGEGVDALFADPARRTGAARGRSRLLAPEKWSPPLSHVLAWETHCPRVGVKVAPGIAHEVLPEHWHAQWTSVDGDLVEAALWSPALAPEGAGRSALVLHARTPRHAQASGNPVGTAGAGGASTSSPALPTEPESPHGKATHTADALDAALAGHEAHLLTDPDTHDPTAPPRQAPTVPLSSMIAEADPAVLRSGTLAHLADLTGTGLVSPGISYLTGERIPASPFLERFEVIDTVPLRAKAIGAALRGLDVGRVEVKKRGTDIDPAALRKSLRLDGGEEATVIATRIAERHRAVIARRID